MIDPYSVIQMPWITEKTLEARRISDGDDPRQQNNNRLEFIVRRESVSYTHLTLPTNSRV